MNTEVVLNGETTIRLMNGADLGRVLQWRNHPNVRSYMLTQHIISEAEHHQWFERVVGDSTRQLLIVELARSPLGFVQFSNVTAGGVADWGFYADPMAPKGFGKKLGIVALDYAFNFLQLHRVCGQALSFNIASAHLHKNLGFRQEGVLRKHHHIGGDYYDLLLFGILYREWAGLTNESGI